MLYKQMRIKSTVKAPLMKIGTKESVAEATDSFVVIVTAV